MTALQFIAVRDVRPGHRVRLRDDIAGLQGLLRVLRVSKRGDRITVEGPNGEITVPIEKVDAAVHVIEFR